MTAPILTTLAQIQEEHLTWRRRNFPNQTTDQAILGMVEELGELSHAYLKLSQGIRGVDREKAISLIIDAHADLIIFSFGVAEDLGYDLAEQLWHTWNGVKQRDWLNHPTTGGE